jgi:AP-1 complex subunit beta-1
LQILTAVVKLFLKRPDKAQGLVQKVLQAATAENDNPDIRDRAYVYWRLLSNTTEPNAAKNVVLSQKPAITSTIQSLPPALLDQLLEEMSTLASVYHTPPEQFMGQGRFGADAVQKAAIEYVAFSYPFDHTKLSMLNSLIREQLQNARENPLAAAAAAASVTGTAPPPQAQGNFENLLDIDFDGAAPASAQNEPPSGMSGLEGLAGTPVRSGTPTAGTLGSAAPATTGSNNMDDLLGIFGDGGDASAGATGTGFGGSSSSTMEADLMNGFAGLDLSGSAANPANGSSQPKKTNEDILSLF